MHPIPGAPADKRKPVIGEEAQQFEKLEHSSYAFENHSNIAGRTHATLTDTLPWSLKTVPV
jgi:hypothetical protein